MTAARQSSKFKAMASVAAIIGIAISTFLVIGCHRPLDEDPKAQQALAALKRLRAATETGILYRDYASAVAAANFSVQQFEESDRAKTAPDFADALHKSIGWYVSGEQLWSKESEAPVEVGYCADNGLQSFSSKDLCDRYPELVTNVPGELPNSGESKQFATANLYLSIMLGAYRPAAKTKTSRGIIYHLGMQEAWLDADAEIKFASELFAGKTSTHQPVSSLRASPEAETAYLVHLAEKSVE